MPRSRIVLISIILPLGLVIPFACVMRVGQVKDPVYQGKAFSSWLIQYDETNNSHPVGPSDIKARSDVRLDAFNAIRHIGTNGLPLLLELARAKDSSVRRSAVNLVMKIASRTGTWRFFSSMTWWPDEGRRSIASFGSAALQSIAEPAVPDLLKMLNDPQP